MGHGLLHQSDTPGRIGALLARSKDSHDRREKVGLGESNAPWGCPKSSSKFAILRDSARYPSGPRERSAKPPFVGSNPTRASKNPKRVCSSSPKSWDWARIGIQGLEPLPGGAA